MKLRYIYISIILLLFYLSPPFSTSAAALSLNPSIAISEIMYNPKGADKDEWIELINLSQQKIDLSKWKIKVNGKRHILNPPPQKGGQGSIIVQPNQYFVIADNAATFLSNHPNYQNTLIDSSFSLTNKNGQIKIINDQKQVVDQLNYLSSWGGSGNGKTLEKINLNQGNSQENWSESQKSGGTPGEENSIKSAGATNHSSINSQQQNSRSSHLSSSQNQNSPDNSDQPLKNNQINTSPSNTSSENQIHLLAKSQESLIYALTEEKINFDGSNSIFPPGTKILWNFGDGQTDSQIRTSHSYSIPETYLATLNLFFKNHQSQTKVKVIIYPKNIFINEFFPNPVGRDKNKEWIEIANQNNFSIDLSNYQITHRKSKFIFPTGSLIAPHSYLVIKPRFSLKNSGGALAFFYPNGSLIQKLTYPRVSTNQSVARDKQGNFQLTKLSTPGLANIIASNNKTPPIKNSSFISSIPRKGSQAKTKNNPRAISKKKVAKIDKNRENKGNSIRESAGFPLPKLQTNKKDLSINAHPFQAKIGLIKNKIPFQIVASIFSFILIISGIFWLVQ